MEVTKTIDFNFEKSLKRMREILDRSGDYWDSDHIPTRDQLTLQNGFYVDCYAIMIDIRDSSGLTKDRYRPMLAKLYRCYISELVAVLIGSPKCKEVNIQGDAVLGIFEAEDLKDVLPPFFAAARINSLIKVLNLQLEEKGLDPIKIGIGLSKGRALMVKAGYQGSGLNDVVWMGDVVNQASNLCSKANKVSDYGLLIDDVVFSELEIWKTARRGRTSGLLYPRLGVGYAGDIYDKEIERWIKSYKK